MEEVDHLRLLLLVEQRLLVLDTPESLLEFLLKNLLQSLLEPEQIQFSSLLMEPLEQQVFLAQEYLEQ